VRVKIIINQYFFQLKKPKFIIFKSFFPRIFRSIILIHKITGERFRTEVAQFKRHLNGSFYYFLIYEKKSVQIH